MNNKAQVFEEALVIVVFVICVMALISFNVYNSRIKYSLGEVYPVVSMFNQQKSLAFYAEESGKLAVQKAYSEVLDDLIRNCPRTQENINYAFWKKDCLLSNEEIAEKFISRANASMNNLIASDFSIALENEKALFKIEPLTMNSSLKDIDINYTSDISFDVNLSEYGIDLNLEKIYDSVLDRWDGCKALSENSKIKDCMNGLKVKGWRLSMLNDDFFCDLENEKEIYTGSLERMILKLKLEK